ncbi:hypothetical protein EVAR_19048_1 [Eumeta japonica]|uniref:Uncharacterized protein n=1 Tax=Eumeta variegata TaxID=151549 RepID=A0A4C1V8M1_EUMVA|nr:hypothetical protein EVAR_19048_1 [Eumeta japonica]
MNFICELRSRSARRHKGGRRARSRNNSARRVCECARSAFLTDDGVEATPVRVRDLSFIRSCASGERGLAFFECTSRRPVKLTTWTIGTRNKKTVTLSLQQQNITGVPPMQEHKTDYHQVSGRVFARVDETPRVFGADGNSSRDELCRDAKSDKGMASFNNLINCFGHTSLIGMYATFLCIDHDRCGESLSTCPYKSRPARRRRRGRRNVFVCPWVSTSHSASACRALNAGERLRLGVTYEKGVTLGNVTMSHRTRERPAECLASLSHSTMIGLPRAQH